MLRPAIISAGRSFPADKQAQMYLPVSAVCSIIALKGGVNSMKSDKELTIEVVISFMDGWNSRGGTAPLTADNVNNLIKSVYKTISELPVKNQTSEEG